MRWRKATQEDAVALEALIESAYRGDASRAGWTTEADLLGGNRTSIDMLLATLEDAGQTVLACDDAEGLLATVTVERRDGYGYIGAVSVRPTSQGQGIGRDLLVQAAERAEVFPIGTRLGLSFALEGGAAKLTLEGVVAWVNPERPAGESASPGMGVRFDPLSR